MHIKAWTVVLLAGLLLAVAPEAHADVRRAVTLRLNSEYTVRGSRCLLTVKSRSDNRIRFGCRGKHTGTPRTRSHSITLVRGDSFTLRSVVCVLNIVDRAPKSALVTCEPVFVTPTPGATPDETPSATPTETPTATPTATPSATPTPSPTRTPRPTPALNANLLLDSQEIVSFNTADPTVLTTPVPILGLNGGQVLVAIDRHPQSGVLYGLGYDAGAGSVQLYRVSSETGVAAPVGPSGSFVDGSGNTVRVGVDSTTTFSIDFNAAAERVRVITGNKQNFRMNPNSGLAVDGSASLSGVNMDSPLTGTPSQAQQIAFDNNSALATTTPKLYALDAVSRKLALHSGNSGTLSELASFSAAVSEFRGFDISPLSNTVGYIVPTVGTAQQFAQLNLTDGSLDLKGTFPSALSPIRSLAVYQVASALIVGIRPAGTSLPIFEADSTGRIANLGTISGIALGETIVGIDYRPKTGVLFGIGVNAASKSGTLYRLSANSGTATAIGALGSIAFVDESGTTLDLPTPQTGYGVDFDPISDQLHVTTGSGLHFRVNPDTGSPIDGNGGAPGTQPDAPLSGAVASLVAIAFTNSSLGQTAATLYGLDAATNSLVIVAADGTTSNALPMIGTDGAPIDFTEDTGFDIQPSVKVTTSNLPVASGKGFVTFNSVLYELDLTSGRAEALRSVSSPMSGITAGNFELD